MRFTTGLLLPLALGSWAININSILALISELFPFDVTLEAAQGLVSDADEALADAEGWETTREDLNDGTCGDVLVIFARGTDEPGNVGALAGPPFFEALEEALGSSYTVAVQGVDDYNATVTEYLEGGDPEGSQEMADLVTKAFTACPSTKVVMSGYSQGGQIVHNAAALLPAATMEKVSAVVIFGDPDSSAAVDNISSSKVLIICHSGDDICQFGDIITLEHLTYAENASTAATFVVSEAGL